jgi:rhodanese-related sulfurtransferase
MPQRLVVKFPLADARPVEFGRVLALFHRFIQTRALEGLLIDVADYSHVPDGPGVMLIGHDVDYGIDLTEGQPGLRAVRKRCAGLELREGLRDALRKALIAIRAIEADGSTGLAFSTGALVVQLLDRLHFPNDDAGHARAAAALEPLLAEVFGEVKLDPASAADAGRPLTLRIAVSEPELPAHLLERLGGAPALAEATDWDIPVEELARLRASGASFALLDVRELHEVAICNLGGQSIPLGTLAGRVEELDASAHVVVHCKTGARGAQAVRVLREAGFANAWNVAGGILAWIERIDPSLPRY